MGRNVTVMSLVVEVANGKFLRILSRFDGIASNLVHPRHLLAHSVGWSWLALTANGWLVSWTMLDGTSRCWDTLSTKLGCGFWDLHAI